ncbi:uncharacterized protein BDW43DRAFT_283083 [Aspergillus alliaceus]|uniref:uncharacterized protein n=1 Tax=Petromyces alliaceus TaxID=209559 RepID=UPI0012A67190|nr:uncharacterized protein BDW43DRAFT_283083 [Aspergillus alliaceus]KAB8231226.1 hypothetical protein BDW43DRAFT_283083 [Aspergillus alliaceus]
MASTLRAKLLNGFIHSHRPALAPHAIASFSTCNVLHGKDNASTNNQQNSENPGYWQYDFSFRTQMGKTVLIGILAGAGALESWTLCQEIRAWWTGVRDDGEEL